MLRVMYIHVDPGNRVRARVTAGVRLRVKVKVKVRVRVRVKVMMVGLELGYDKRVRFTFGVSTAKLQPTKQPFPVHHSFELRPFMYL